MQYGMKVQDIDIVLVNANIADTGQLNGTTSAVMKNNLGATKNNLSVLSHFKYEHLLAGISGGAISTLILHPLDLLKIRFAVSDGRSTIPQYTSLTSAFYTIIRQEGIRGLYKGVAPNVWGSGSAWGFYFLLVQL
ncbi:hypothetical protein NQ315_002629 [Exocentrus adspersus]|uniref:Mitochondrial folate transporter/carrier n=1 Tax=Exocentrus adspersus TaxID=1586481 RepID=A0AAV8VUP6_9CUCU|nr:hypothetical protein NQ315_002629 [Exocentrus adspersus]